MRTVALLILALTASSVMSATTCPGANAYSDLLVALTSNAIVAGDVLTTASANAAATTVASAKCAYTAGTTVTCVAEAKLIPAIQQYITNLKTTLETASGVRDTYIIAQRGEVIDVLSSLRRINELASNDDDIPTAYATVAALFIGYADEIATNFTAIVENFDDYQEARATCMDTLLQAQAGILCNVFTDPVPATGFTATAGSEDITLTDTFLTAINDKCYTYFQYSERQSSIILTSLYSAGIASLVSGIEAAINGDATTAATDLTAAFTSFGKASVSATNAQKPVELPTECATSAGCIAWIESDLFTSAGLLVNDAVVRGGDVPTISFTVSRALESEGKERRLAATGGMPVTLASYTFTTGFAANPGNVDNTENANSALRNGIVAVAVAALALVF